LPANRQANRRYLYFANKADVEGYPTSPPCSARPPKARPVTRTATSSTSRPVGDPATGLPIGADRDNLKAAIAGETHEYTDMYPGMAKTARDEGFDEIADWFETWPRPSARTPTSSRRRWTLA
jgi:rubrerythrin